jgi:hypothetical protein
MDVRTTSPTRDRYDRHVRRTRMCISAGAPRHRLAFAVEEALRLASLPGEDEGRYYYFRHLRVTGLPMSGDRARWLEIFQRALIEQASQAVHGSDARAASAAAVFFRGEVEALEILLRRILARQPSSEWFWPIVTSPTSDAAPAFIGASPARSATMIPAIVEQIRATSASWAAVAATIFAVPGLDAVYLLNAVPARVAETWLREMEGLVADASGTAPVISSPARSSVEQAMRAFGLEDTRTIWLATLAVVLDSPAALIAGVAVSRARVALRKTAEGHVGGALLERAQMSDHSASSESSSVAAFEPYLRMATAPPAPVVSPLSLDRASLGADQLARCESGLATAPWFGSGLPTSAAGLFFLLNVLQRIGMAEAFAANLGRADPQFAARLMRRFAAQAGVDPDDPIRLWVDSLVTNAAEVSPLSCDAAWWPSNLRVSRCTADTDYLVRFWCLGVRLWCWRTGKLTLRAVVCRSGVFSVNRIDLDVSMPLDEADVRVRRVGLDLDPGWLPWFGRVVRFHYPRRGELNG